MISSPLLRNTQNWKTKTIQNHIFHYPYSIEDDNLQIFADKVIFYNEKLINNNGESHYYLCKDETNPLKLFGVDYNGYGIMTRYMSQQDHKSL